jgi:hypothetical protein
MSYLLWMISLYLTIYTVKYALKCRKKGFKFQSIVIILIATTFIPLTLYLNYFKD